MALPGPVANPSKIIGIARNWKNLELEILDRLESAHVTFESDGHGEFASVPSTGTSSRGGDNVKTDDDGGGEWENCHQSGGGTFDNASSGPRMVSGPSSSNSEASIRVQVASHE